jgi:subtilisin family serine protease
VADRNSIIAEDYVDYIIEYNGDREALIGFYPDEYINFINDRYAVVYVKKPEDYMEIFSRIEYNLFPKVFGLVDMSSMEAAGVINVRQENILGLSGQGTLIAIIDTGIDISDKVFLDTTGRSGRESVFRFFWLWTGIQPGRYTKCHRQG